MNHSGSQQENSATHRDRVVPTSINKLQEVIFHTNAQVPVSQMVPESEEDTITSNGELLLNPANRGDFKEHLNLTVNDKKGLIIRKSRE